GEGPSGERGQTQVRSLGVEAGREFDADARGQRRPCGGLFMDVVQRVEHEITGGNASLRIAAGARYVAQGSAELQPSRDAVKKRKPRAIVAGAAAVPVLGPIDRS